jgi:SAM-dependent methyltransferase
MLGELYETALAGLARPQIEHADGRLTPMPADVWTQPLPGDESILCRCLGPTLDIGSGPGRLTLALGERGIPALGIDVTPYAVRIARATGALALLRDVFADVPGTGRWETALLADGNIGIGGDPETLLRRVGELLMPGGSALVEVEPPGTPMTTEKVRLCCGGQHGPWFRWASVGSDQIGALGTAAGLQLAGKWTVAGRHFVALSAQGALADAH